MNHCTQCGNKLSVADQFCGKCGSRKIQESLQSSARKPPSSIPERRLDDRPKYKSPAHVPALKTADGEAVFAAINGRKAKKTRAVRLTFLFVGLLLGGLTVILGNHPKATFTGGGAALSLLIALIANFNRWSETDYYKVPGSRDTNGEHRCIHCGNRGIYRHGQYKSDSKYADCSKCKENLWTE